MNKLMKLEVFLNAIFRGLEGVGDKRVKWR